MPKFFRCTQEVRPTNFALAGQHSQHLESDQEHAALHEHAHGKQCWIHLVGKRENSDHVFVTCQSLHQHEGVAATFPSG